MAEIPPKRLSRDVHHPYFDPDVSPRIKVCLNGVRQDMVMTYDQCEGWVERYKRENGRLVIDRERDEYVQERVYGVVSVEYWR